MLEAGFLVAKHPKLGKLEHWVSATIFFGYNLMNIDDYGVFGAEKSRFGSGIPEFACQKVFLITILLPQGILLDPAIRPRRDAKHRTLHWFSFK